MRKLSDLRLSHLAVGASTALLVASVLGVVVWAGDASPGSDVGAAVTTVTTSVDPSLPTAPALASALATATQTAEQNDVLTVNALLKKGSVLNSTQVFVQAPSGQVKLSYYAANGALEAESSGGPEGYTYVNFLDRTWEQTPTTGRISFFGPWVSGLLNGTLVVSPGPEIANATTLEISGPGPIAEVTESMYVSTSSNLPIEAAIEQPAGQLTEMYHWQAATAALSASADITPPSGFSEETPAQEGAIAGPGVG
jgi:hypothetical protein